MDVVFEDRDVLGSFVGIDRAGVRLPTYLGLAEHRGSGCCLGAGAKPHCTLLTGF